MSYVKHNFKTGDFLYADHLNEMEDGIIEAGGGYDLVIGVGSKTIVNGISQLTKDDFSVLEGNFSALKEKIDEGKPAKVLLKHVEWYGSYSWIAGTSPAHTVTYSQTNNLYSVSFMVDCFGSFSEAKVGYALIKVIFSDNGEIHSIVYNDL